MSTPSERRLLGPAVAVTLLALAAALAWRLGPPQPAPAAPGVAAAVPAWPDPVHECAPDPVALAVMREDSSMGDPQAALTLVSSLLDRYESAGHGDDLREAAQWMERGWAEGHFQASGLATRLFERHCGQGAISGHWLCEAGE